MRINEMLRSLPVQCSQSFSGINNRLNLITGLAVALFVSVAAIYLAIRSKFSCQPTKLNSTDPKIERQRNNILNIEKPQQLEKGVAPTRQDAEAFLRHPSIAPMSCVKYMDGTNISNLYLSGLPEDLIDKSDTIHDPFSDRIYITSSHFVQISNQFNPTPVNYTDVALIDEQLKNDNLISYRNALNILCLEAPPPNCWIRALRNGEVVFMFITDDNSIKCLRSTKNLPTNNKNHFYPPYPPIRSLFSDGYLVSEKAAQRLILAEYTNKKDAAEKVLLLGEAEKRVNEEFYMTSYSFNMDEQEFKLTYHWIEVTENRKKCEHKIISSYKAPAGRLPYSTYSENQLMCALTFDRYRVEHPSS